MEQRPHNFLSLGGRAAIVVMLIVIAAAPAWLTDPPGRDLIVLWDDSISMQGAELTRAWQRLSDAAAALDADSRVGVLRFAAEPVMEIMPTVGARSELAAAGGAMPPRTGALDRSRTDLGSAIAAGLHLTEPGRGMSLAVISDGRDTGEQAETLLGAARDSGIPVYALVPGENPAPVIQEIRVPAVIRTNQNTPVDVSLHSGLPYSGALSLSLDNELVASTPLQFESNQSVQVRFWINAGRPGAALLRAELRSAASSGATSATNRETMEHEQGIEVVGPSAWLAISREPRSSIAIAQMRSAGWPVRPISPEEFLRYEAELDRVSGIILDDLSASDLTPGAWSVIDRSVRQLGTSLLVLGGPNSFGAGAYRGSVIEALLPVTAETDEPRQVAAVLFAIDASGSMGKGNAAVSAMSFARRAVLDTSKALGQTDQIGIIAFDVAAEVVLPLRQYAEPAAEMESASMSLGPSGGTRLRPALEAALHQFDRSSANRRMLVLATDGFFDDEELDDVLRMYMDRQIEIIVLAIGRGADLTRIGSLVGESRVFPVHDVATLPLLMRTEVERRRNPTYVGPVDVIETRPLPGLNEPITSWPGMTGFARTRPRSSATVYLRASSGDPLLAVHHAGVGRVAAFPAGLGGWAGNWRRWSQRDAVLNAMQAWLAQRGDAAHLFASTQQGSGNFTVTVDSIGEDLDWSPGTSVDVTVVDPARRITIAEAARIAPGRYQVTLPARQPGRYLIGFADGEYQLRHTVFRGGRDELRSRQRASPIGDWLGDGLLRPWPETGERLAFGGGDAPGNIYPGLLLAVLLFYCLLILYPRRAALSHFLARAPRQKYGE